MIVNDEIYERLRPKKAIKEELGGGYFYRCPYLLCNLTVRSDWEFCPYCGTKLVFEEDDYTRDYYT